MNCVVEIHNELARVRYKSSSRVSQSTRYSLNCVLKVFKAIALSLIPLLVEILLKPGHGSANFGVPYLGEVYVMGRAYPGVNGIDGLTSASASTLKSLNWKNG